MSPRGDFQAALLVPSISATIPGMEKHPPVSRVATLLPPAWPISFRDSSGGWRGALSPSLPARATWGIGKLGSCQEGAWPERTPLTMAQPLRSVLAPAPLSCLGSFCEWFWEPSGGALWHIRSVEKSCARRQEAQSSPGWTLGPGGSQFVLLSEVGLTVTMEALSREIPDWRESP